MNPRSWYLSCSAFSPSYWAAVRPHFDATFTIMTTWPAKRAIDRRSPDAARADVPWKDGRRVSSFLFRDIYTNAAAFIQGGESALRAHESNTNTAAGTGRKAVVTVRRVDPPQLEHTKAIQTRRRERDGEPS